MPTCEKINNLCSAKICIVKYFTIGGWLQIITNSYGFGMFVSELINDVAPPKIAIVKYFTNYGE